MICLVLSCLASPLLLLVLILDYVWPPTGLPGADSWPTSDVMYLWHVTRVDLWPHLFQAADLTLARGFKLHLPPLFELFTLVMSNCFQAPMPHLTPKEACGTKIFHSCFTQMVPRTGFGHIWFREFFKFYFSSRLKLEIYIGFYFRQIQKSQKKGGGVLLIQN